MSYLEKVFEESNIAVCIRNKEQTVLYQNQECAANCSVHFGKMCGEGCMETYNGFEESPERNLGTQYYPNYMMENKYYDLIFLESENFCTTLLFPLKEKHAADLDFFKKFNLTNRELEITEHIIKGCSNSEIASQLNISKSTLKTHLNHIYKKIPHELIFSNRKNSC
jgi:ATP/maltotriose-dependent transcriptional regulator MalT